MRYSKKVGLYNELNQRRWRRVEEKNLSEIENVTRCRIKC